MHSRGMGFFHVYCWSQRQRECPACRRPTVPGAVLSVGLPGLTVSWEALGPQPPLGLFFKMSPSEEQVEEEGGAPRAVLDPHGHSPWGDSLN